MILDLIGVKEKSIPVEMIWVLEYWMIALITIMIVVVDTIVVMMILPSIMFFQYLRKTQSKRITLDILSILIFIMGLTFGTLGTIATIQQS